MWKMLSMILSISHNNVMDLDNVMSDFDDI